VQVTCKHCFAAFFNYSKLSAAMIETDKDDKGAMTLILISAFHSFAKLIRMLIVIPEMTTDLA